MLKMKINISFDALVKRVVKVMIISLTAIRRTIVNQNPTCLVGFVILLHSVQKH